MVNRTHFNMHPLADKIADLQRRLVLRRHAAAACAIAATILAAALVLGLADYFFRFADPGLRLMATAALVGVAAWAAYRWWLVPRRQPLGPLTVARQIERRFPALRDSLASAVEFLQQSETDPIAGSPQLRRIVVTEAATAVASLPLDDVIDRRPLRRTAGWLALAAAAALVCVAIDAGAVATAAARLVAPLNGIQWPRQNYLLFRDPPNRLALGQPFEVELIDTAGQLPDDVRIEYRAVRDGRRVTTSDWMTRAGDAMVARRDAVRESFSFRATGGDDHTMAWHHVEVVEPPTLESLSIVVHPPAYTGLPPAPAERHLEVLAGSGIEVTGTAGKRLGGARVLVGKGRPVAANIDATAGAGREFHIPPDAWIAARSAPYRLELEDSRGVAGVVGQWNLRVVPDSPPSVSWQRPADDLYVTTMALVPIELVVKDDLAIERVELIYERLDQPDRADAADAASRQPSRIEIYRGPAQAAPIELNSSAHGETRIVEHAWDLDALRLPAGAQLAVHAEAADYRPGTGRTIVPRRVTIVTAQELEARLADRQAHIARELERALATERTTREDVRRLEIQQRDAGTLDDGHRNALQTAELSQRRVRTALSDPAEGVPALVDAIVAELDMSRLHSAGTRETMQALTVALDRLADGPLATAERELTAARKSADTLAAAPETPDAAQTELLARSLSAAGAAQAEVIAELERLLNELSGWNDYHRFVRELTALREDQLAHERTTREEIGLVTLPLEPRELTRAQRANLNMATAGQEALARRYERVEQGMAGLARELARDDAATAAILADAVSLAQRLAVAADIHQAARELRENRTGRALALQRTIAEHLQQVLDVLRHRAEDGAESLAERLQQAEVRLAELRDELAQLRQQLAQAERQPAPDPNQREQIADRQQQLREQIEELAQRLQQLEAEEASRSVQQAADRLDDRQLPDDEQATASRQAQQAEQDLAEAARQLAARRQQAEIDLALEFVRRFQSELGQMVERQRSVIRDTAALDAERTADAALTGAQSRTLERLVDTERALAGKAREHSELLFGLGALRLSLEEVAARLDAAAELLAQHETGPPAQEAEARALERLEGIAEAFAQTAAEAGADQAEGGAGDADPDAAPPRRPTFELLEVKVLRMLQADLHERTRRHQERLSSLDLPPGDPGRTDEERETAELAAQQGRLAELVEEMLSRDNEQ